MQQSGYTPLASDAADAPADTQKQTVSGRNAAGAAEAHWSGMSAEEARAFPNCPSDQIMWPEYDAGFG